MFLSVQSPSNSKSWLWVLNFTVLDSGSLQWWWLSLFTYIIFLYDRLPFTILNASTCLQTSNQNRMPNKLKYRESSINIQYADWIYLVSAFRLLCYCVLYPDTKHIYVISFRQTLSYQEKLKRYMTDDSPSKIVNVSYKCPTWSWITFNLFSMHHNIQLYHSEFKVLID